MTKHILQKNIIEMVHVDQSLRTRALKTDEPQPNVYNWLVYVVDAVHNQRIHTLIKKYGYPKKKTVGDEALHAFWLLIQHQDFDIELQKKCLSNCDFALPDKAHLVDRILKNTNKKQRFGTQSHRGADKKLRLWPVEDKKNLNTRRKKHKLPPLPTKDDKRSQ